MPKTDTELIESIKTLYKDYPEEINRIISDIRIEERFIANQLMGDLGVPVDRRIGPNGHPIYEEAAKIVMGRLLAPPRSPAPDADKDVQ